MQGPWGTYSQWSFNGIKIKGGLKLLLCQSGAPNHGIFLTFQLNKLIWLPPKTTMWMQVNPETPLGGGAATPSAYSVFCLWEIQEHCLSVVGQ